MDHIQKHIQENVKNMDSEIVHGDISTNKITKGVWIAKCEVTAPLRATVEMTGASGEEAIAKLEKFLEGK